MDERTSDLIKLLNGGGFESPQFMVTDHSQPEMQVAGARLEGTTLKLEADTGAVYTYADVVALECGQGGGFNTIDVMKWDEVNDYYPELIFSPASPEAEAELAAYVDASLAPVNSSPAEFQDIQDLVGLGGYRVAGVHASLQELLPSGTGIVSLRHKDSVLTLSTDTDRTITIPGCSGLRLETDTGEVYAEAPGRLRAILLTLTPPGYEVIMRLLELQAIDRPRTEEEHESDINVAAALTRTYRGKTIERFMANAAKGGLDVEFTDGSTGLALRHQTMEGRRDDEAPPRRHTTLDQLVIF